MSKPRIEWQRPEPTTFGSVSFTCGYCGSDVASEKGFWGKVGASNVYICICHRCSRPNFIDYDRCQYPGSAFGEPVADITDPSVQVLYDEARRCFSVSAHTSAVLACRKLLMHIAVSKGAEAGKPFVHYVQYLADQNYVPPDARQWIDHIRAKGNEANHEIVVMQREEAEELISFVHMLLKMIFEFPAAVKRRAKNP
jgi:hypothetical protein